LIDEHEKRLCAFAAKPSDLNGYKSYLAAGVVVLIMMMHRHRFALIAFYLTALHVLHIC